MEYFADNTTPQNELPLRDIKTLYFSNSRGLSCSFKREENHNRCSKVKVRSSQRGVQLARTYLRFRFNEPLEENKTNILGTLRADNGDANENVAEKWIFHPFKLFRDCFNSHSYKKKENLIGAAERGTRPKRQTEMVEFNISSCRSCFQVNLKFSPVTS